MFEGLASYVSATLGPLTYKTGLLLRTVKSDNGAGTLTEQPADPANPDGVPVKVQVDTLTQAMRNDAQYADDAVRLLILNDGLPGGRVQDDDRLAVGGATYAVNGPQRDALNTHWIAGGRIVP